MPRYPDHAPHRRCLAAVIAVAAIASVTAAGVGRAVAATAEQEPQGKGMDGGAPSDGVPGNGVVSVASRQAVTVEGRFESLQAVIKELCEKSGVELRDYSAPDRPIVAHYEAMPLRKVLRRLLSEESFALGMAKAPESVRARITWVRVVGSSVSHGKASVARSRAVVLPRNGYASPQAAVRRRAAFAFGGRLNRDTALKKSFIETSNNQLVNSLVAQRFADDFLKQLRQAVTDRRVQLKISQVQAALRRRRR